MAIGETGREPALLIKQHSLALRYFIRNKRYRLLVFRPTGLECAVYAVQISDGGDGPTATAMSFWSIFEREEEIEALYEALRLGASPTYLFNEASVNIASADLPMTVTFQSSPDALVELPIGKAALADSLEYPMKEFFDALHRGDTPKGEYAVITASIDFIWHEIKVHYTTKQATSSTLSIMSGEEGGQQEELALWLIDELQPSGAHKNPLVREAKGKRELSDLLLTYPLGGVLFESKNLAILLRETLPNRKRLALSIKNGIRKAVNQLEGGCKNVKRGAEVLDAAGNIIQIPSDNPLQCIVIVPDLDLLSKPDAEQTLDAEMIRRFAEGTRSYLHILDPYELLSMVQIAHRASLRAHRTTATEAFDAFLLERWKASMMLDQLDFRFNVKFRDDGSAIVRLDYPGTEGAECE